jgi:NADPH-dependent curcumin reductase CurA
VTPTNLQVLLARRPEGRLRERDFELREAPRPRRAAGEVLVRTLLLSIDAANRVWLFPVASYRPPVEVGAVMDGVTLCEVVESDEPSLPPGCWVECEAGWQQWAALPVGRVRRVERRTPATHLLSALGPTGRTAHVGVLDVARVKPGDTFLVSAAAGGVGSLAGQLARLQGCRVVGVAGSDEKCHWLTESLGFHAAINYRTEDLAAALSRHCPGGVDVYFDNVGGRILQTVLFRMALHGRIVCCGEASVYDTDAPLRGPLGVPGVFTLRRLRMEGFLVLDHEARAAELDAAMAALLDAGQLTVGEDLLEGLESAPRALVGLLAGENLGKRLVRVAPES